MACAAPASAFELFGYSFFEQSAEKQSADIVDPVNYEATLELVGADNDLRDAVEANSLLLRQKNSPPAGTVGLISRASDDRIRLIAPLYEFGHYSAVVEITIAGRELDRIGLTETLGGADKPVPVHIKVKPGPVFRFGSVSVGTDDRKVDEPAVAAKSGLVPGDVAKSTIVLDAESAVVAAWGEVGHPFAKTGARRVIADHQTNAVDVVLRVDPGPQAVFGEVTVVGADRIDPAFVRRHADIPEGQTYDSRALERARLNLRRLEALGGVVFRPADRLEPGGRLPIVIEISERKRHVIGGGAAFSSTEGAEVLAYWKHRNLFGQAEVLRLEGAIGRIFEAYELDELDARALIEFHKPGVFNPRTDMDLEAGFIQEDPDPYHREAFFFEGLLSERKTDALTLRVGAEFDVSWIDDAFGSDQSTLIGVPLIAEYDTRDKPLDASEGVFVRLFGEPFVDAEDGAAFVRADAEIRYYHALDGKRRAIVAVRGNIGTIAGASLSDIPAHRRFYAGGAGSVRGYDLYDIGPRVTGFGATGGRSKIEGSLEARLRVTENFGVVPFFDAGLVSIDPTFSGTEDFQAGAGIGLRYYTAVGPIRLDVAVPVNPREGDPDVAFYLGIGQAF